MIGFKNFTLPATRRGKVLASLLLVAAVLAVTLAVLWFQLPRLDKAVDYRPRQALQVFTQDGVSIAQFGAERRQFVPIAEMPKRLQDAVLAVEDSRFREHAGIDLRGLLRAVVANLTGGMRQGASTITQQVARTFFLTTRRTLERKAKEALLAIKLERQLSKDQILELYLNQIYLGQRSYGFAAASQAYFGKPLQALSIAETAMLAGLPQNPVYANPISNFERATQRQAVVLQRMVATGVISEAEAVAARAEKLQIRSPLQVEVHAEHVAEMARQAAFERFGDKAYTEGYKVFTSLRAADQQAAWEALRHSVIEHDRRQPYRGPEDHESLPDDDSEAESAIAQTFKEHRDDEDLRLAIVLQASPKQVRAQLASGEVIELAGEGLRWGQAALSPKAGAARAIRRGAVIRVQGVPRRKAAPGWTLAQWPEAEAAFVALDPLTGRVRALVGGFDFTHQQFNHVTQAWRQPGSSFKPFLYSAALEHRVMPATQVNDAPLEPGGDQPSGWDPRNSDDQYDGPITLRQGLARSKNMVSIRVLQYIGVPAAREWVARFGFDLAKQPDSLSLALGTGSTTPMQLAQAYAVLANGGWRIEPVVIERITDAHGQVLFEAPPAAPLMEANRAVPARNVFVMDSLLQEVTRSGTAAKAQAQLQRPDLYGKTGTTNDAVDAWFAGFQPSVVGVAWMGYDTPRSLGSRESGGGLALPIWIGAMKTMLKGVPVAQMAVPEGVQRVDDDWRYSEWAEGGYVEGIGLPQSLVERVTEPLKNWLQELFSRPKAASSP
ncbi:MAG: PBP1A family penicillin-binding protein [Burkholderiales bacterium]